MKLAVILIIFLFSTGAFAAWKYEVSNDPLGGTVYSATVESTNKLRFSFPYHGAQRASLLVRDHPRWGISVIVAIRRGQFSCTDEYCGIRIKFDKNDVNGWAYNKPSDHSMDTIFIDNTRDFIDELKRSKRIYIEASFYQEGERVLEFDISNLKWPMRER